MTAVAWDTWDEVPAGWYQVEPASAGTPVSWCWFGPVPAGEPAGEPVSWVVVDPAGIAVFRRSPRGVQAVLRVEVTGAPRSWMLRWGEALLRRPEEELGGPRGHQRRPSSSPSSAACDVDTRCGVAASGSTGGATTSPNESEAG